MPNFGYGNETLITTRGDESGVITAASIASDRNNKRKNKNRKKTTSTLIELARVVVVVVNGGRTPHATTVRALDERERETEIGKHAPLSAESKTGPGVPAP